MFPISRNPPEGGTFITFTEQMDDEVVSFQFLGIPPKGEHHSPLQLWTIRVLLCFQFLGIPPKGEHFCTIQG